MIDIIEWVGSQDWEQGRLFSLQEQIDHKVILNVPLFLFSLLPKTECKEDFVLTCHPESPQELRGAP